MSTHRVTIRFESDWTIGTGKATSGFVDQAVKRDHCGLPIVEGGYLLGLWRDAAESVAKAFDQASGGEAWEEAVHKLFGKGGVHGDALLRTKGDAQLIWANYLTSGGPAAAVYRERLIVHRHATQIDEARGVAKNETLRIREAVRAGTVLGIDVELPEAWDAGIPWPVELLLAAALRRLDHLSGKRRRGAGKCVVTATGLDFTKVANAHGTELLHGEAEQALKAISWPRWPETIIPRDPPNPIERQRWRLRLRYAVDLDQPVVASKRVVGNTIESHDYLPGAFVLPIIARAFNKGAGSAIADAHLVVTPAHPDVRPRSSGEIGHMSARTPQTWVSADKGTAWTTTGTGSDAWSGTLVDGSKPIAGWAVADPGADQPTAWIGAGRLDLSAHPFIDDHAQRPLEDGMFALQAIPAGQRLVGEIWDDGFLDADAIASIKNLADVPQRFGRGRKRRGLGQLTIEEVDAALASTGEWPAGTVLRVRLLTDTVLLDAFGFPQPSASVLADELGCLLAEERDGERRQSMVEMTRSAVSITRIESWNTTHGLPRTSVVALAAGSVVEVTLRAPVDKATLEDVLASGLGELRVEGYGRVALLDAAVPHLVKAKPDSSSVAEPGDASIAEPDDTDWLALRTAMWADELQRRALAWPLRVRSMWFDKDLESGDLRSLRTAARESLRLGNAEPLDRWCGRKSEMAQKLKADLKKSVKGQSASPLEQSAAALLKPEPSYAAEPSHAELATDVPSDLGGLEPARVVATFVLAFAQAAHRQQKSGERHGS